MFGCNGADYGWIFIGPIVVALLLWIGECGMGSGVLSVRTWRCGFWKRDA